MRSIKSPFFSLSPVLFFSPPPLSLFYLPPLTSHHFYPPSSLPSFCCYASNLCTNVGFGVVGILRFGDGGGGQKG
jgi:hypothetical protein